MTTALDVADHGFGVALGLEQSRDQVRLDRFREFDALPGDGDDDFVRWALWSKDRAIVSHATALSIHDLGTANPSKIHLTVPPGFRQNDSSVIFHKAELTEDEVEERGGFRVTTPVRAIVECAAAHIHQDAIDSAVFEALEQGMTTRRLLLHAAQRLGARAELGIERALRESLGAEPG